MAIFLVPFMAAALLPGMKLGWLSGTIVNACPIWLRRCSTACLISVYVVLAWDFRSAMWCSSLQVVSVRVVTSPSSNML